MNMFEKFYTDAQKIIQRNSEAEYREMLRHFFCKSIAVYDKELSPIAEDIAAYWLDTHREDSPDKAVEWLYAAFSFLAAQFESDMDFSDDDWTEITAIISASADLLSIETVQSLMQILVERHKI